MNHKSSILNKSGIEGDQKPQDPYSDIYLSSRRIKKPINKSVRYRQRVTVMDILTFPVQSSAKMHPSDHISIFLS